MVRASRLLARFELRMSITYRQLALVQFFFMLVVITHWLANLWALSLVLVDADDRVPQWTDAFSELEKYVTPKTKDSPWKLYLASVYFTAYTLTSVGYGDIGPLNIVERFVCTIMIVISGISWAVVLGQVCGILASMNVDEQAFRTTMDDMNIMMMFRSFPPSMKSRVRAFIVSSKTAQRVNRHQDILRSLSPGLRKDVALQINRLWIEKVSFFKPFMSWPSVPSLIIEVCLVLKLEMYAQTETFGLQQTLYIVHKGLVSHKGGLHRQGSVWGLDFLLSDPRLIDPADSFCLTYVEVAALTRQAFLDLLQRHQGSCPELAARVRWFVRWLAFQRAVWVEVRRRMHVMGLYDATAALMTEAQVNIMSRGRGGEDSGGGGSSRCSITSSQRSC